MRRAYSPKDRAPPVEPLLEAPHALIEGVMQSLHRANKGEYLFPDEIPRSDATSSVLFLLSEHCQDGPSGREPCIIFNKRSARVRQPGDLCFPGGRISTTLDSHASRLLTLPFSPLGRWPHWDYWRRHRRPEAQRLALLLATALRESFEEMRLSPFAVRFLGPMPSQSLSMFGRLLYPMVVSVRQKFFFPNWEVEKVVPIPLRSFFSREHYACCRVHFQTRGGNGVEETVQDFPCFRRFGDDEKEVLWGVTYSMVMAFLEIVFQFRAPEISSLPVVHAVLGEKYLNGSASSG